MIHLTLDINNLVRFPGRPQTYKSTASSTCRSSSFWAVLLMTARLCFAFCIFSHHPGDSEPTPVNPCYDGSHTCATTARCHPHRWTTPASVHLGTREMDGVACKWPWCSVFLHEGPQHPVHRRQVSALSSPWINEFSSYSLKNTNFKTRHNSG